MRNLSVSLRSRALRRPEGLKCAKCPHLKSFYKLNPIFAREIGRAQRNHRFWIQRPLRDALLGPLFDAIQRQTGIIKSRAPRPAPFLGRCGAGIKRDRRPIDRPRGRAIGRRHWRPHLRRNRRPGRRRRHGHSVWRRKNELISLRMRRVQAAPRTLRVFGHQSTAASDTEICHRYRSPALLCLFRALGLLGRFGPGGQLFGHP